ncbi:GL15962, partial [Drosophila persimilis]
SRGTGGTGAGGAGSPLAGGNSILGPRYHTNASNDYNVHSSQNGPRSLSDSSQAESPVQEDLLSTNTPNLGSGTGGGGGTANGGAANGGAGAAGGGAGSASSAGAAAAVGVGNPGAMLGANQNFPGIVNQAQHASASAYGGGAGVGGGHCSAAAAAAGCNGIAVPGPARQPPLLAFCTRRPIHSVHGFPFAHATGPTPPPNSSVHGGALTE